MKGLVVYKAFFATAFAVAILFFAICAQAQDIDQNIITNITLDAYGQPITNLPPSTQNSSNSDVPQILPRSTWENTIELKNLMLWFPEEDHVPPDYAAIERIIVHDLGCSLSSPACNSDTVNPVYLIQNIYRFHAAQRGWDDIGYNYIIDRQGRIYEGKFGGNGVRGAHAYVSSRCENFNIGSVGILLLGNYSSPQITPLPEAMQKSLVRLSAWIAATNGLDLTGVSTEKIWKNIKVSDGSCDISQGDWSGTFSGPVLLSHGDVEPGNSDKFDFTNLRIEAKLYTDKIKNLAYRENNSTSAYKISDGVLREFVSGSQDEVVVMPKTQLDLFPIEVSTLLRSYTRDRIYVIENGKRRGITSSELFTSLGYKWEEVKLLSDRGLALYPLGDSKPYPDGALVKGNGPEVYKFESSALRYITSTALFPIFHFSWSKIIKISDKDLNSYSQGPPILFPDGTLISTGKPKAIIYKVEEGQKRPISSMILFAKLKLNSKNVKKLSEKEVSYYPSGKYISWPDGTLLKTKDNDNIWYIQKGFKRWIQSAVVFKAAGFSWKSINVISADELSDYPEAQVIAKKADIKAAPVAVVQGDQTSSGQASSEQPTIPGATSQESIIRIGIYSLLSTESISISVNSAYTITRTSAADEQKNAGDMVNIVPSQNSVIRIIPKDDNAIITVNSYSNPAYNGGNDNTFRGKMEIAYSSASQKYWVINELSVESYLKGIAEMGNGEHPEYAKAFMTAARSYALHYVQIGGKRAGEIFHLNNTSGDQWYKGYNFELRAKDTVVAVLATRGMVASFNSKPILAAYSSGAPGPTKNACLVWGGKFCTADFPYLGGGVDDPPSTVYKNIACSDANHCVGLDADGARQMASIGVNFENILKTYYSSTILTQIYK